MHIVTRSTSADRLSASTDTGTPGLHHPMGEPLYPDTVTTLMTKLINRHNKSVTPPAPRPSRRNAGNQLLPYLRETAASAL